MPTLLSLLALAVVAGAPDVEADCTKRWLNDEAPSAQRTRACRDWWLTVPYGKDFSEDSLEYDPNWPLPRAQAFTLAQLERARRHVAAACKTQCTNRDERAMEYFSGELSIRLSLADVLGVSITGYLRQVLAGERLAQQPGGPRLTLYSWHGLRKLRNAVFARHGRPFKDADLHAFFYGPRQEDWVEAGLPKLTPDPRFSESRLTDVDKQNLAALDAALSEQKKAE
ncbi:MAG TPA: YARHG domain-containing protein [Myxococcus sp.]|jgi:hypothetical protein|nr:YARHG domain-containing protein [Myxococcus sp.]